MSKKLIYTIAVILFLVSIGIELAQGSIPGRMSSYGDVIANFIGVLSGTIAGIWLNVRNTKLETKPGL